MAYNTNLMNMICLLKMLFTAYYISCVVEAVVPLGGECKLAFGLVVVETSWTIAEYQKQTTSILVIVM